MKLIIENWRTFANNRSGDDQIINEAMELCRTYKKGLLIPKNKNQRMFLEQLQEMLTLLEQGEITRRQFAKGMAGGAAIGLGGSAMAGLARAGGKEKTKAAPAASGDIGSTGAKVAKGAVGLAIQGIVGAFDLITMGVENFVTQCYIDFLRRRKAPLTKSDLDQDLIDCLKIIAEDFKRSRKSRRDQWGSDRDYARVAKSKMYIERFGEESPGTYNMQKNMEGAWSIADSLTSTDPLNNIFNTLTHVNITLKGETVQFRDIYDFNPAVNILGADQAKKTRGARENKAFFQNPDNFVEFAKSAVKGNLRVYRGRRQGWIEVGFFSRAAIENLSRFYIGLFNYPGYKVNIEIPTLQAEPFRGRGMVAKAMDWWQDEGGKI
tara:strand:+ start:14371 stop:15504 length:1134 start_codon:yes stop_codon:yes gene_type:complete